MILLHNSEGESQALTADRLIEAIQKVYLRNITNNNSSNK